MSKRSSRHIPQQSRSQDLVDRLLDSAAALFAEVGYEATTTNAIAEKAGVSIGSLYRYFPDRKAVLSALAERHLSQTRELHDRVFTQDLVNLPLPVLLDRLIDPFLELHLECPALRPPAARIGRVGRHRERDLRAGRGENNAVSGIVNLSRNMGGDIGIALVTTLIARRSQFHQASLAAHLDPGSQPLFARIAGVIQSLQHAGSTSVEATRQAYGVIYRQFAQQAQTLAYADVLFIFSCFAAAMVPLVFLTRRVAAGRPAMGH